MNRKLTLAITFIMLMAIGFTKAQLAGNYTIGGTTPDYATVIDAVNDLNLQGISAPVVFNIRDGVYPGKVFLTTVTGATFTNTVTFQSESGDSTLVTLTDPTTSTGGSNYLISLTNADYITFNQVTLERSGTLSNSCVIAIAGGCDYNNFTNCIITTANTAGVSSFSALVYSVTTTSDNYNIFMNNRVENGSYGFYFFSSPTTLIEDGNMIMNNLITGQTNYGLQVGSQSEFMVAGNYISTVSASYANAIYASSLSGNSMIMDNKIELPDGGTGISLQQSNGGAGAEIMVANNFVSVGLSTGSQAYGIRTNGCSNTGVYFNNVNMFSTITVANNYAFNAITAGTNLKVFNNVFSATTGYVAGINNSAVTQMNNNDLYTTGFNFGLIDGATAYNNLAQWQTGTGFDANSVSIDPAFVSSTDLHVASYVLNALAAAVTNITTDIDGDLRDALTPDIGADEFYPPSYDVGVTKIIAPYNNACADSMQMVAVIVKNYSAVAQTNVTVDVQITGFVTSTQTAVITNTIAVLQSDTAFFALPVNTLGGGILNVTAYTSQLNDEDISNDTLINVDTIRLCIDAGVTKIVAPYNNACGDSLQMVAVVVTNFTDAPQVNIPLEIQITGFVTSAQTAIFAGPIPVGQSDTVYFALPVNTYLGGILNITCFTTLANDENIGNDTLNETDTILPIPPAPTLPAFINSCVGNPVSINATFAPNFKVYWYNASSGGIPIATGNPLVVNPIDTTTYYASVLDTASNFSLDDSLETMNAGGNGSAANFFDVTNTSTEPVIIHYLSTLIGGANTATVYYLPGGLTSCTTNPVIANFTMVGSAPVTGLGGAGSPYTFIPVDMNVTIPAGQTYAFCISCPGITYTNGTGTGTCPVFASDAVISIHEGFGGTTAGPIANRRLNGRVSYSIPGGGCPSDRVSVEVNVVALPVIFLGNDTTIAAPNTVTLDAGAGFASYLWSNGATTQTIVVIASGNYTVTVTDSTGCVGSDVIAVIVLTGINDFGANSQVILSPVPASDYLKVTLKNMAADNYTITLLNNLGQKIMFSIINIHDANVEKTFSLSGYQKGVYYVEVKSDKGIYRQRILKQ